jgi:hypothetical protein
LNPAGTEKGQQNNFIGWAGEFEDISLSRWLRRVHNGSDPTLALTTFEGHLKAAKQGLGAAGLPVFVGSIDPDLKRIDVGGELFVLEAWTVMPNQIAATTRIRKASQVVAACFHQVSV